MKVNEVISLRNEIEGISERLRKVAQEALKKGEVITIDFRFSYALAKNADKLKTFDGEVIEPFRRESIRLREKEGGKDYADAYTKICEATGKKDEKGNFMLTRLDTGLIVPMVAEGEEDKRKKKIDALDEKYKEFLTKSKDLEETYKKKLDEDVDMSTLELRKINVSIVPPYLLPDEVDSLLPMLVEDAEPAK